MVLDDTTVHGHVQDIVYETNTQERLYFVKYTDGDMELLTQDQVVSMQVEGARPSLRDWESAVAFMAQG
eukprot:14344758-Alexandrium_andersonii.AAC.1